MNKGEAQVQMAMLFSVLLSVCTFDFCRTTLQQETNPSQMSIQKLNHLFD